MGKPYCGLGYCSLRVVNALGYAIRPYAAWYLDRYDRSGGLDRYSRETYPTTGSLAAPFSTVGSLIHGPDLTPPPQPEPAKPSGSLVRKNIQCFQRDCPGPPLGDLLAVYRMRCGKRYGPYYVIQHRILGEYSHQCYVGTEAAARRAGYI